MADNEEAPLPPYQENVDAPPATYNATATPTSGEPKQTEQQNQPPPDGEGEFGDPLKRLIWIGGCLFLYCILAFWLSVYWMDYYINYCEKLCDNEYPTDPTSASQCTATCKANLTVYKDTLKLDQRISAYSLMTHGIAFVGVGVILGYFGIKKGNRLYCQITAALLGLGGLMAIIGIILKIAIPDDPEDAVLAALIVQFVEVAIPGSIAILLAYDVFNPLFLNVERNRWLYCTSVIFVIFGLMGGVLYAYIANYEVDGCVNYVATIYVSCANPYKSQFSCIAAGYFLIAICSLIRILIFEGKIQIDNPESMVTAKLAAAVLLVIGAVILAAGYWAYIDAVYDGVTSSDTEDQNKCYYVALTLFIIGIAIVNAMDMGIVKNWKSRQAPNATVLGTPLLQE